MLNMNYELVRLSVLFDWIVFEDRFGGLYHADQVFSGKPTRFRQRIGKEGCEWLLQQTIQARVKSATEASDGGHHGAGKGDQFPHRQQVVEPFAGTVDTSLSSLRRKLATKLGPIGPRCLICGNRYAHARQFKRMRFQIRKLHTYLERVVHDIEHELTADARGQRLFADELEIARRLAQQKNSKNKLYSLHPPEVKYISKGKVHKRYEFGVKASISVTNRSNIVLGSMALPGNPFDDHTLKTALDHVRRLSGQSIDGVFVDSSYRGHDEVESAAYISGQKRGVTPRLRRCMKYRQAIKPVIRHLKNDRWVGRNHLKDRVGDYINVLPSCAGYNLRLVLKRLRDGCAQKFFGPILGQIFGWKVGSVGHQMRLSSVARRVKPTQL